MDNDKKTLHELGFGSKLEEKNRTKKNIRKKLEPRPPNSTTLERLQELF